MPVHTLLEGWYRPTAFAKSRVGTPITKGQGGILRYLPVPKSRFVSERHRTVGDKSMNSVSDLKVGRRGFFRLLGLGTIAAAANASVPAEGKGFSDRRRARYRGDSPEVQTFYRVNRYPAKTER
jgi:hypothetical protein